MGKPEPIQSILPSVVGKLQQSSKNEIDVLWKRFLGRKEAKTRIEAHHGGKLVVSVENASLLYELSLQKEELIQKFEKALGGKKIQEIHFQIGDIQ